MSITLCLVKVKITVNRFHFTAEFPLFLKQMHSLKPVRWEISLVAQTFTTGCRFCKLKLKKKYFSNAKKTTKKKKKRKSYLHLFELFSAVLYNGVLKT